MSWLFTGRSDNLFYDPLCNDDVIYSCTVVGGCKWKAVALSIPDIAVDKKFYFCARLLSLLMLVSMYYST